MEDQAQSETADERPPQRPVLALTEFSIAFVVLIIIGAVMIPILTPRNPTSGRSSCATNLQTILVAYEAYGEANDGYIVPRLTEEGRTYEVLLSPYSAIPTAWACPTADSSADGRRRTIGMNRAIAAILSGPKPWLPTPKTSDFASPNQTITFVDDASHPFGWSDTAVEMAKTDQSVYFACMAAASHRAGNLQRTPQMDALLRHEGRGNFAYADGHTRYATAMQTLTPDVEWFADVPPLTKFRPQGIRQIGDCMDIGIAGGIPGRDPRTKR